MTIDRLKSILPPPDEPVAPARPGEWPAIEAAIGTPLPQDYKEYVEAYGSGRVDGFISIYNPFSENEYLNLVKQIPRKLDVYREIQKTEVLPFKLFPEMGGLLPLGGTDNGDSLFWVTRGTPDHWSIAVNEGRGPVWDRFDKGLTAFLVAVLKRTIRCAVFPDAVPSANPRFVPSRPRAAKNSGRP